MVIIATENLSPKARSKAKEIKNVSLGGKKIFKGKTSSQEEIVRMVFRGLELWGIKFLFIKEAI